VAQDSHESHASTHNLALYMECRRPAVALAAWQRGSLRPALFSASFWAVPRSSANLS